MTTDNVPQHTFHDKGPSLADLVATSSTWEAAIVPIGSAFRQALAALTAVDIAVAVAVVFAFDRVDPHAAKPGLFLAAWPWFVQLLGTVRILLPGYIALGLLLVVAAILTEGFAVAGRRLQITLAIIATVTTAMLLPAAATLLIPLANIVAYIVGIVILVIFMGWMLLAMLDA